MGKKLKHHQSESRNQNIYIVLLPILEVPQFDGKTRVMYGKRRRLLVSLKALKPKNVFTQCETRFRKGSVEGVVDSIVVKGGMTKAGLYLLWTAIQDVLISCSSRPICARVNAGWGRTNWCCIQIGDAIFLRNVQPLELTSRSARYGWGTWSGEKEASS